MDQELADFVRWRYQHLVRRAYLLTGSAGAAEDLVQDALARCCVSWRRNRVAQPDAYVQRVMINLTRSHHRRPRVEELSTAAPPDEAIDDGAKERAQREAMWRILQQAPPRQRAVLVLRYYEDMDEAAIAAVLNVSIGTVRSQAAKGLARMRYLVGSAKSTEGRL